MPPIPPEAGPRGRWLAVCTGLGIPEDASMFSLTNSSYCPPSTG